MQAMVPSMHMSFRTTAAYLHDVTNDVTVQRTRAFAPFVIIQRAHRLYLNACNEIHRARMPGLPLTLTCTISLTAANA